MPQVRTPGGLVRRVVAHPAARCAASCLIGAALRRLNARDVRDARSSALPGARPGGA